MPERDPDKVTEDLENFRCDGDRERLWDEIMSSMDVEFDSDTRANVKHVYLGLAADDDGVKRLTCDAGTWEMEWAEREAMWIVDGWGPDDTYFQVDFIKDRIPWKKIRGLLFETDEECAEAIADNAGFQNFYADTVADMDLDDNTPMHSVIRDPLLRKALRPPEERG
jgi:hypothetical protein